MTHRVICAIVATMKSKFSWRFVWILGVNEPNFLPLHFDDVFEVVSDLPIIEGPYSDHDLNAIVSHGLPR
jgi:hypothetical protein